jgi:tetratricopeptide (TPR) repeat protein
MWKPDIDSAKAAKERVEDVFERGVDEAGQLYDRLRVPLDPTELEATLRGLPERLRRLVDDGRYSKVRVKFRGKQLLPDLPLGGVLAGELLAGLALPIGALLVNIGAGAFLDIELLHAADGMVAAGQVKLAEGEVEEAEALYRGALKLRPDDANALFHLGVLLRVSGRRDEAAAHFERVVAIGGANAARAAEALDKLRRAPGAAQG